jgi:putative effector of murein hydrolase
MMIQIVPLAAAFALFTNAIRYGETYHGGSPWINVVMGVIVLAVGFPLARSLANDIK